MVWLKKSLNLVVAKAATMFSRPKRLIRAAHLNCLRLAGLRAIRDGVVSLALYLAL